MNAPIATRRWRALGTTAIVAVAEPQALQAAEAVLADELESIDRACSRFRPDSELNRLNAASGAQAEVGALLFEALQVALRSAEATGGLVDPTIGRTLRLSGYDATFSVVQARDGRLVRPSFVRDPDWRCVALDEERHAVRMPPGVELDLGATAKAFAADRAASRAHAVTGTGVLVSLGGDVAVAGQTPSGGWSIRIAEDNSAPLDVSGPTVAVFSGGVATSGTTVRSWASRAGRLHHIVDPRSGRPANDHWRTVTVAATSCVDANTASTAAVVLGEHAPQWLAERGLPARLVRYDLRTTRVAGWPEHA